MFTASEAASYATLDLKPQLAALGLLERQVNGNIGLSNLFDGVLAAYLLNPLKMSIHMRILQKTIWDR